MINNTRRPGAVLALALTVILSACSVEKTKTDTTLATDTALKNDLALANRDSAAQPQLQDVPANAGAAPAPAPTTTRTPPRTTSRPTTSRPTTSAPKPAPTTTTTASGNTV